MNTDSLIIKKTFSETKTFFSIFHNHIEFFGIFVITNDNSIVNEKIEWENKDPGLDDEEYEDLIETLKFSLDY
jgi:hypothetical protein